MLDRLRQKRPGTPLRQLLFYELIKWIWYAMLRVVYRLRVVGVKNVPARGAVLLVANHQSFLDPPMVSTPLHQRHIDFIARMGLFKGTGFFGRAIAALNALPINEEGSDAGAIKEVLRRLEKGYAVLIFPEGSRTENGAMEPFKRGVAVLVKRSKCPVLPIAVEGSFDAWPRGRKRPRVRGQRLAIEYGKPISHDELMAEGAEAGLLRLGAEVERMRLGLRARLRRESTGTVPPPGPGDAPAPWLPPEVAGPPGPVSAAG